MTHYEVRRSIDAPVDKVWTVLTDKELLQTGEFGILRLTGDIMRNGKIKLWSEVDPKRAFSLKVVGFDAPSSMVWQGGMPFGLFKGERVFTLKGTGELTNFTMRETFTGVLSGMITRSIPDLGPSFEKFGDALKHYAEERA